MPRPLVLAVIVAVSAATGAVAAATIGTAHADEGPREPVYECGTFEIPENYWHVRKETWQSAADNGLTFESEARGVLLPPGWAPVGGAGSRTQGAVVACRSLWK